MMRRDYTSKKTIGLVLTAVGRYCAHIEDAIFTYKSPATSFSSIVDWSMGGVIIPVSMKIVTLLPTAVIHLNSTRANFIQCAPQNTMTFAVRRKIARLVFFVAVCSRIMRIFMIMYNENVSSVLIHVSVHKRSVCINEPILTFEIINVKYAKWNF